MLIGISGKKRSGKDTVGGYLVEQKEFKRKAFADDLKTLVSKTYDIPITWFHHDTLKEKALLNYPMSAMACEHLGEDEGMIVDGIRYHSPRTLCILEGYFKRVVDPLYWCKKIVEGNGVEGNIVITDVRYQNEADYIKSKGGILLRVNRLNTPLSSHLSETDLDLYTGFDGIIENNSSIKDLLVNVDAFVKRFT